VRRNEQGASRPELAQQRGLSKDDQSSTMRPSRTQLIVIPHRCFDGAVAAARDALRAARGDTGSS
jgi:hypothetical protein